MTSSVSRLARIVNQNKRLALLHGRADVTTRYMILWGRRGRDHMVVGFTTSHAISAYHH
jgi:hypothetical protein